MDADRLRAELAKLSPGERRALEARLSGARAIPRAPEGPRPLSFAQQRLWFIDRYEPQSAAYNMPVAFRLHGALDPDAVSAALRAIVARHEVLRTSIATRDGVPLQIVRPPEAFALKVMDFESIPAGERHAALQIAANSAAARPFDLGRDLMLRATLLRSREDDHVLLLVLHHIAADGWSLGVLMDEFARAYRAKAAGLGEELPELPIQYADHAAWQREHFTGAQLESQLAYWRERLAGAPATLDMPFDRPRPPVRSFRGGVETRFLPRTLLERLQEFGRGEGATPFMVLAAGYALLLSRYSGQKDIVLGTPVSGRERAETAGLIGLFVNTLALRTDLEGRPSFRTLLARVRAGALDAYAHQDLPFEALVEALKPRRSTSHSPVFQVSFALQNAPAAWPELPGLTVIPFALEQRTAKFDLALSLTELPWGLGAELEYDRDLFDAGAARRLLTHFGTLLGSALAEPDRDIAALALLDEAERQQILVDWNRSARDFPREESIAALFEKQARERPDAIAIVSGEKAIRYGELDRRADIIAAELREAGIGTDMPVAVALERGPDMIAAWLGVLKAGGAYVPIAPGYPPARRQLMLEDCGASVLIGRRTKDTGIRIDLLGPRPDGSPLRPSLAQRAGPSRRSPEGEGGPLPPASFGPAGRRAARGFGGSMPPQPAASGEDPPAATSHI